MYAPTDNREQENFTQSLSVNLTSKTDTSRVIIVGDWNTTLNKLDKHGGLPWKETTYNYYNYTRYPHKIFNKLKFKAGNYVFFPLIIPREARPKASRSGVYNFVPQMAQAG